LPQLDASGQDPGGRRFRIENGDSLGEKEEVIKNNKNHIF